MSNGDNELPLEEPPCKHPSFTIPGHGPRYHGQCDVCDEYIPLFELFDALRVRLVETMERLEAERERWVELFTRV